MRLYIAVDINDPDDELAGEHPAHLANEIVGASLGRVAGKDVDDLNVYKVYKVTVINAGRNLISEIV